MDQKEYIHNTFYEGIQSQNANNLSKHKII